MSAKSPSESPAAKCGLQRGDVITKAADKTVTRGLDFERALLDHKAGEEIQLIVRRDQQPVTLNLVLAAKSRSVRRRPTAELAGGDPTTSAKTRVANEIWELLGLKLEEVSAKQLRQSQTQYRGGMSVVAVRPDSPAARQGIRRGDVLVGLHIWETHLAGERGLRSQSARFRRTGTSEILHSPQQRIEVRPPQRLDAAEIGRTLHDGHLPGSPAGD